MPKAKRAKGRRLKDFPMDVWEDMFNVNAKGVMIRNKEFDKCRLFALKERCIKAFPDMAGLWEERIRFINAKTIR